MTQLSYLQSYPVIFGSLLVTFKVIYKILKLSEKTSKLSEKIFQDITVHLKNLKDTQLNYKFSR